MNDSNQFNLADKVLEAVCADARREGSQEGFEAGMAAARALMAMSFQAAGTVLEAYRNGDHTILLFADGGKERVTWHREPGSRYDAEKAVMACMLKHLMGSRYIRALKAFGDYAPKGACGDCEICGCRACGRDWPSDDPVLCDPEGEEAPAGGEPVYCDAEDRGSGAGPVHCDPDEAEEIAHGLLPPIECEGDEEGLREFFENMADEPGFGPEAFQG